MCVPASVLRRAGLLDFTANSRDIATVICTRNQTIPGNEYASMVEAEVRATWGDEGEQRQACPNQRDVLHSPSR
jgi:hypothetical protein